MSIIIDEELCTGCGNCVDSCPFGAIELENNKAKVLPNCNLCGACLEDCPVEAITLERGEEAGEKIDISQFKGVWVIAEHYKSKIHNVAFQLLGKGRELSEILGVNLTLVILGDNFDERLGEISQYGMDEIIYVKSAILKNYYSDLCAMMVILQENKYDDQN